MKEDWNFLPFWFLLIRKEIPRHYPSEGGLKPCSLPSGKRITNSFRGIIQVKEDWNALSRYEYIDKKINSEALSKWRRIETRTRYQGPVYEKRIPRHYPSEGGLKLKSNKHIISKRDLFRGIIQVKEDWNYGRWKRGTKQKINSEALSKWRRIETKKNECLRQFFSSFRGIIQVKEDWNLTMMNRCLSGHWIPRHYPSEGGLKPVSSSIIPRHQPHSEALSKWRRIETRSNWQINQPIVLFRGIIQVKEDWNIHARRWTRFGEEIPRHYPSEGGLKLGNTGHEFRALGYSEALSKWRRIETLRSRKEFQDLVYIPRHYPSEGGLKHNERSGNIIRQWYSEALSKWRRIETWRCM